MNNSIQSNIQLWVRAEPLTYGILHVNPHPRLLSLHNIKKLVSYAKGKGKSGYPKLSYPIWKHIACNKLQLSDNLAWMLFQTCIIMSSSNSSKLRSIETKLFSCDNEEEREKVKAAQSIELFKFVLFLYIQQINKISLRANAASPNAEWPEVRKSIDADVWKSENKNMDEIQHLQFVLQNIGEILDILTEIGSHENSTSSKPDVFLSQLSIEAMNLIIEGRVDRTGSVRTFSEILQSSSINPSKIGYTKISKTYDIKSLSSWLRSHLATNPFGIEACINHGKRLAWSVLNKSKSDENSMTLRQQAKKQKIATTANLVPKEFGSGNKVVLISSIYNQTIARSSGTLENSTLKIHRCYYSYLYLLSPLRCVSIEKCRKTTICVGPVENTLQLLGCDDCVVIAPTRRLVLIGCRRCTIYTNVASSPLLCQGTFTSSSSSSSSTTGPVSQSASANGGGVSPGAPSGCGGTSTPTNHLQQQQQGPNEDICLAPYFSYYPSLEEHLTKTYLDTRTNFWNLPVPLGATTIDRCWELMPPIDFYPITIPFEMEGPTITCPFPLPLVYEEALNQRSLRYEGLHTFIKNSNLTAEQGRFFRSLVEKRFRQWLTESDEYRQLILLDPSSTTNVNYNAADNVGSSHE